MKITYDEKSDSLMIEFTDAKPKHSTTIGKDTVLHQSATGQHVYMQIRFASRYIENPRDVEFVIIPEDAPPAGYIEVDSNDE